MIYVLVVRVSASVCVDPSVSVVCEYECECVCECECDFERNRECKCKCNGENKISKERRVCVQGFSTATSLINMCAWLSCQGVVSLFERSHVIHQRKTPSYYNHHLNPPS